MQINSKKRILMLGSLPMSLSELPMAPAVLASVVRKRGHEFKFIDINLRLYHMCDRDKYLYDHRTELLQSVDNFDVNDTVIQSWYHSIMDDVHNYDMILVNVFSVLSQSVALRLCRLIRQLNQTATILMGGIGSHKMLLGGINSYNIAWAQRSFSNLHSDIFGQILVDNGLVDGWQSTVGTDVIESWLPQRINRVKAETFDFDVFDTEAYEWTRGQKRIPMLGSHGCVRQCSFCDVIKHFPAYNFVEADQLTKDIIAACGHTNIYQIQFMDSLVNGSMSNFLSLLNNLAHARAQGWLSQDFSWSGTYICRQRSRQLDRIHEMLAPSGVDNLIIGVETGSDRIRFEMDKKFRNVDLMHELTAFRRNKIKASALFFPSWPTETEQDFQHTLQLFDQLAEFGQGGTLHSVSLGTTGFALIDGTPIDKDKHKIGLEQGPRPWLWHCTTNPDLTFWETVRRRLLMAEWCEMLGIQLDQENRFRRYLAFNLDQDYSAILEHAGQLPGMIDVHEYLPRELEHVMSMEVTNHGNAPVRMRVSADSENNWQSCDPGITKVNFAIKRHLQRKQCIKIDFEFFPEHRTQWATWNSGDYHDANGVYLDNIWIDSRDISYWGWNHLVEQHWHKKIQMPSDYTEHRNLRCVTAGMNFQIDVPAHRSLHQHLARRLDPESFRERDFVDQKVTNYLSKFLS